MNYFDLLDTGSKLEIIVRIDDPQDLLNFCTLNQEWTEFCMSSTVRTYLRQHIPEMLTQVIALLYNAPLPRLDKYRIQWLLSIGLGSSALVELTIQMHLPETLRMMIQLKVDFNPDASLRFAVEIGDLELVRDLLNLDADPNQELYGSRLLLVAITRRYHSIAEELLRHGAEVDHRDSYDRTALMEAVYVNDLKGIELLLEYKADPFMWTHRGTPYEWAQRRNVVVKEMMSYYNY